jgi:hypothetical protein
MATEAWDEAVAAHAALTAVQEQLVDVVRRALDLAADQERRPAAVAALRTEAAGLLAQLDGQLASLEQALDTLGPD